MIYLILLAVTGSCSGISNMEVRNKINFVDVATTSGGGSMLVAAGVPQQFKPLVEFICTPLRLPFMAANHGIEKWFNSKIDNLDRKDKEFKLLKSIRENDVLLAIETFKDSKGTAVNVNKKLEITKEGQREITYFLHFAIANSAHMKIVELILDAGANISQRNSENKTALMLAVEKRDINVILKMVEKDGSIIDAKVDGMHLMHLAAAFGKLQFLDTIYRRDASSLIMSSGIELLNSPLLPLDFAVLFKQENAVKKILQLCGSESAKKENVVLKSELAFSLAAAMGSIRICRLLIESGVLPVDIAGNNVLHFLGLKNFLQDYVKLNEGSVEKRFLELVQLGSEELEGDMLVFLSKVRDKDGKKLLIMNDMLLKSNNLEDTPIHTAARFGDYKLLKGLIAYLPSNEARKKVVQDNRLQKIAQQNLDSKLIYCLKDYMSYADIEKQLKFFIEKGSKEDIFCLLALVHSRLEEETKAMWLSESDGQNVQHFGKLLHAYGNSESLSLLERNVFFNQALLVEDINRRDDRGKSYLDYCIEFGNLEMFEILVSLGARLQPKLLHDAIKNELVIISKLFPVDLFVETTDEGESALDLLDETREWLAEDMLKRGINSKSESGKNLAMVVLEIRAKAAGFCDGIIGKLLLSCDLNHQDAEQNNIFHLCSKNKQMKELAFLLNGLTEEECSILQSKNLKGENALDMIVNWLEIRIERKEQRGRKLSSSRLFRKSAKAKESSDLASRIREIKQALFERLEATGELGIVVNNFIALPVSSIESQEDEDAELLLQVEVAAEMSSAAVRREEDIPRPVNGRMNANIGKGIGRKQEAPQTAAVANVALAVGESIRSRKEEKEQQPEINQRAETDTTGFVTTTLSPLMMASVNGNEQMCRFLLRHGADVNAASEGGMRPLIVAAQGGHEVVCRILMEYGANVNIKRDDGVTALMVAAQNGHETVCKLLIERGADVNVAHTAGGATALTAAARNGHRGTCRLLLRHGADVNAADNSSKGKITPLIMASTLKKDKELCELLLESGAEVDARCAVGAATALMLVAEQGDLEMCKLLIEKGANINLVDANGATALAIAVSKNHMPICKYLIEKGAKF